MTWDAAQARDRSRATVVILCDIATLNGGPTLRLSDRNLVVSGVVYCDYLASVSGVGDTLFRATSGFSNAAISVVFRNDKWDAYAHLSDIAATYPLEGAVITIKEVFLDDDGTPATPETIWKGRLDSAQQITGIAFSAGAICEEAYQSQRNR